MTLILDGTTGLRLVETIGVGNEDTTITRSAAGVIAVEGGVVPKENRANTFTADQTFLTNAYMWSDAAYAPNFVSTNAGTTGGSSGLYTFRKSRGTYSVPTSVASGDQLGGVWFYGHDGSNYIKSASIDAVVNGTPGTNDMPGALTFNTTADGTNFTLERMRIDSSGNVGIGVTSPADKLHVGGATSTYMRVSSTNAATGAGIRFTNATGQWLIGAGPQSGLADFQFYDGNASSERMKIDSSGNVIVTGPGGLGYGTGSGGTVTQATSKSTAVTLNKTNGRITMNNAALGAGAEVLFSVTNSTVSATDVILANHGGGAANNDNYRVVVVNPAAGSFRLSVRNVSGGSLSEALVINFAIIKAVTS
jgi:hypothetical protein